MVPRSRPIIVACVTAFLLTSCGIKGPLKLPPAKAASPTSAAPAAPTEPPTPAIVPLAPMPDRSPLAPDPPEEQKR